MLGIVDGSAFSFNYLGIMHSDACSDLTLNFEICFMLSNAASHIALRSLVQDNTHATVAGFNIAAYGDTYTLFVADNRNVPAVVAESSEKWAEFIIHLF